MLTDDKVTEIFCICDDFCKEFNAEIEKSSLKAPDGRKHRRRNGTMSEPEVMTILICFHFKHIQELQALLPLLRKGAYEGPLPQSGVLYPFR